MIKRILRLLLPTTLYIWTFVLNKGGKHFQWQEAKTITWMYKRIHPLSLLDRAGAWAIVICLRYIIGHVIHAIMGGELL
jgi:hypothetical protein